MPPLEHLQADRFRKRTACWGHFHWAEDSVLHLVNSLFYLPGLGSHNAGRGKDGTGVQLQEVWQELVGESTRLNFSGSRAVGECKIKAPTEECAPHLPGIQLLRAAQIRQVLLVGPHHKRSPQAIAKTPAVQGPMPAAPNYPMRWRVYLF